MSEKRTLILALGNPRYGDDRVGQVIGQTLFEQETLPDDVVFSEHGMNGLVNALLGRYFQRRIMVETADHPAITRGK